MAAGYDLVAQATKFVADRASTGKSSITRQKKRRVIAPPDRDTQSLGRGQRRSGAIALGAKNENVDAFGQPRARA